MALGVDAFALNINTVDPTTGGWALTTTMQLFES